MRSPFAADGDGSDNRFDHPVRCPARVLYCVPKCIDTVRDKDTLHDEFVLVLNGQIIHARALSDRAHGLHRNANKPWICCSGWR